MNPLRTLLAGRSEREARVIAGLVAIVALTLLVAIVWLPLERARMHLASGLPALRASVESLQRQADEVKRLRTLPAAATQQAPVGALVSSPPAGAQVAALDPKRVRLTANDAAFTTLLEWIVAAETSHGLRVESAKLESLAAPGRVKADILMTRS